MEIADTCDLRFQQQGTRQTGREVPVRTDRSSQISWFAAEVYVEFNPHAWVQVLLAESWPGFVFHRQAQISTPHILRTHIYIYITGGSKERKEAI